MKTKHKPDEETIQDILTDFYGSETIDRISEEFSWETNPAFDDMLEYWNKPSNIKRIKLFLEVEIFHNRAMRKMYKKHKLGVGYEYTHFLIDSLVSFGLLRVERYYAHEIESRRLCIFSLLTVSEERRLAYLRPYLSKMALEKLKAEEEEG